MNKLLIIDGNAICHRAYHAIPMLNNTKGEPTNAVYGFVSMLISYLGQFKPTHLIVCFDEKEKTFRKKEYENYQAKRPEMDEWLSSQITKIREWLPLAGITVLSKGGYEADDIIGTIISQITNHKSQITNNSPNTKFQSRLNRDKIHNTDAVIVTGDRDIFQLITINVKVFTPTKGLGNGKLWGIDEVIQEFDFKPPQIVDYKALVGDSSDNYPGVAGIGPKTARDLIVKYGNVENIFANLDKIGENIKTKLVKGQKDANFFKKLATIFGEVPVKFNFENTTKFNLASDESIDYLKNLGFKSIIGRLKVTKPDLGIKKSGIKPDQLSLL